MRFFTISNPAALVFSALLPLALSGQEAEAPRQPAPDSSGAPIAAKQMAAARARIQKTGDHHYQLGDIHIDSATRTIRFPATLNMVDGLLEYALVHENGKTHESLLRTSVSPTELNLALLLAHYEPHVGEAVSHLANLLPSTQELAKKPMQHPGANRLNIEIRWKKPGTDTGEQSAGLAGWIHDKRSGKALQLANWTYTGSLINETGFAAEFDGSIIGIYFDLAAMINCPVSGNDNDELWQIETARVPPLDTPVTVIISPAAQPK